MRWMFWKYGLRGEFPVILYDEPNLNEHDKSHGVAPPRPISSDYDEITAVSDLAFWHPCPPAAPIPKAKKEQ